MHFFHHYSCDDRQTHAAVALDMTEWHNYAVEWTEKGVIGFLDGAEWFRDSDPAHQPPGPMHQTIQLDWFPDGTTTTPSWMDIDWVRVYEHRSGPDGGPQGETISVAAVGDLNPERNWSASSPSARNGAAIARALDDGTVDAFFGLGDLQYSTAYCPDYVQYWSRLWGRTSPGCTGCPRRTTTGGRAATRTSTTLWPGGAPATCHARPPTPTGAFSRTGRLTRGTSATGTSPFCPRRCGATNRNGRIG